MKNSPAPLVLCLTAGLALAACTDDPQYMPSPMSLEVGAPDTDIDVVAGQFILPIRLETEEELMERQALEAEVGVPIPYVTVESLSVSIEWTITNLSDTEGTARININGGNEEAQYVPTAFVIDPEEDEEPPPLAGGIPITVPATSSLPGVIREDQIFEAAIDLGLISRAGENPFAAILQHHDHLDEITDTGGLVVPVQYLGQMVLFDVVFQANRHMVLEYTVRVRDHAGILHELLLDAPAGELTGFAPTPIAPPPPVMP